MRDDLGVLLRAIGEAALVALLVWITYNIGYTQSRIDYLLADIKTQEACK